MIDAKYLPEQSRWWLVLPPGTRSDRAECYRVGGHPTGDATHYLGSPPTEPDDWTLADVRGTHVSESGSQELHVLRPVDGSLHAPLRGWAWPRGDAHAQAEATQRLVEQARDAGRPFGRGAMGEAGLAALRRLNDCASCHVPRRDRVILREDSAWAMERETDNLGFFVPTAVLADDSVVAHHRPKDLNQEDPFVEVPCGDTPARMTKRNGSERFTCADGEAPVGYRDVAAGLAAGHAYTERVCESRRWLYDRMTERARKAYADAFTVCGIPDPGAP